MKTKIVLLLFVCLSLSLHLFSQDFSYHLADANHIQFRYSGSYRGAIYISHYQNGRFQGNKLVSGGVATFAIVRGGLSEYYKVIPPAGTRYAITDDLVELFGLGPCDKLTTIGDVEMTNPQLYDFIITYCEGRAEPCVETETPNLLVPSEPSLEGLPQTSLIPLHCLCKLKEADLSTLIDESQTTKPERVSNEDIALLITNLTSYFYDDLIDVASKLDCNIVSSDNENLNRLANNAKIETAFAVYPNPSSGNFSVKSDKIINTIHILDANGVVVYSNSEIYQSNYTLDLPNVTAGIYHTRIVFDDGSSIIEKVVIY